MPPMHVAMFMKPRIDIESFTDDVCSNMQITYMVRIDEAAGLGLGDAQ